MKLRIFRENILFRHKFRILALSFRRIKFHVFFVSQKKNDELYPPPLHIIIYGAIKDCQGSLKPTQLTENFVPTHFLSNKIESKSR